MTDYYASTTAGETTAGGAAGYEEDNKIEHGDTGTPILLSSEDYFAHTSSTGSIYPMADSVAYRNTDGSVAETTIYSYTWYADSLQEKSQTVSKPVIHSSQNGSAHADTMTTVFDTQGRTIWTQDGDGYINYTAYDETTGAVIKQITDVDNLEYERH